MNFRIFKGTLIGWKELFDEAARFATELGPARLRRISHSASGGRGIVTVWYGNTLPPPTDDETELELRYEFHRGTLVSWEDLFSQMAEREQRLAAEQFVSFSHSDDNGNGIVTLWYWEAKVPEPETKAEVS